MVHKLKENIRAGISIIGSDVCKKNGLIQGGVPPRLDGRPYLLRVYFIFFSISSSPQRDA